jgi:glycosyltransferase involved in cell wall biosynthesis
MRYAWTFFEEYFGASKMKAMAVKPLLASLRKWDRATACEVDSFVAISNHVAKRIKDFYGRDSRVVYPPVDLERCSGGAARRPEAHEEAVTQLRALHSNAATPFDLIVSALVPYKRVDLAVELYTRKNWNLKVVGVGGEFEKLKRIAGPTVELLGPLSDPEVVALYQHCHALIFPGEEDYGIVPLEAQACGRPVVAFAKGGALETVADGTSGLFFAEQTLDSLEDAVLRCKEKQWDSAAIRANAERFGPEQFLQGMAETINDLFNNG